MRGRGITVATGRFRVEDLRREGADHAVASLAEPEAQRLLLGS